jgi:magnesium transporter
LISIFVHRNGSTESASSIDRSWLGSASGVFLWVDLASPSIPESLILSDTFRFHPLSVEDAMAVTQYPKVEAYDGYLYVVLHGIDFRAVEKGEGFATHDVDFFIGPNYLVTVHSGESRSILELGEHCVRNPKILGDGPVVLFHRVVDAMIDHYTPEVEKLEDRLDALEQEIFDNPDPQLAKRILKAKRDVAALRRIVTPERDVVARLARREFVDITTEMSFRFRDLYDHLVRIGDDGLILQDRLTGILEAHLSMVNNQLNEVMKVLAIVATVFMPLTLMTGVYGMNIPLPHLPGGETAQFWWLTAFGAALVALMLVMFRRKHWI